jgi:hypothetical protein
MARAKRIVEELLDIAGTIGVFDVWIASATARTLVRMGKRTTNENG